MGEDLPMRSILGADRAVGGRPPLCCVEVKLSRRFLRGRGVMSCIGHSPQLPNPASSQNLGETRPDGDVEIGSRGAGAEW